MLDTERTRSYVGSTQGLMDTDEMAESYWKLHTQGKKAWTWEIDLRPYLVCVLKGIKLMTRRNGRHYVREGCI